MPVTKPMGKQMTPTNRANCHSVSRRTQRRYPAAFGARYLAVLSGTPSVWPVLLAVVWFPWERAIWCSSRARTVSGSISRPPPGALSSSLPPIHFHDLRHTGNTLTAEAGANLRELIRRHLARKWHATV